MAAPNLPYSHTLAATRVRAGSPVPPATSHAVHQAAEHQRAQLRQASHSAFADGAAVGERLGYRAGLRWGCWIGGMLGLASGASLVVGALMLGYSIPLHW